MTEEPNGFEIEIEGKRKESIIAKGDMLHYHVVAIIEQSTQWSFHRGTIAYWRIGDMAATSKILSPA